MQQPPYQPGPPTPPYVIPKQRRRLIPSTLLLVGIMFLVALVVCGLCAIITNATSSTASSQTSTDPTPTTMGSHMVVSMTTHSPTAITIHPTATSTLIPTPKPTAIPTPTPKPTVLTVPAGSAPSAPILGANINAFIARYGPPDNHTDTKAGLYHFRQYPGSNIDFLILLVDTNTHLVENVNVNASDVPDQGWTSDQANTSCSAFFPPDAVYQSQVPITIGTGYDKIYFSASLAHALPAATFEDAQQNPVKPGMFDAQYLGTSSDISSCNILPGTSQTQ